MGDNKLLEEHKKGSTVEKTELESSLKTSNGKQATAEPSAQRVENIKNIFDKLATRVDEDEKELKSSEEYVRFLDEKVAEKSNQFLTKPITVAAYQESVVALRKKLMSKLADGKRHRIQRAADKNWLDAVHTALAFHKTAPQQGIST